MTARSGDAMSHVDCEPALPRWMTRGLDERRPRRKSLSGGPKRNQRRCSQMESFQSVLHGRHEDPIPERIRRTLSICPLLA